MIEHEKLYQPFLDPDNPNYEGTTTRDFSGTCKGQMLRKIPGSKKTKKGKKCSLKKGHEEEGIKYHEHWQFLPEVTKDEIKNGRDYEVGDPEFGTNEIIHIKPWELGSRVRRWK